VHKHIFLTTPDHASHQVVPPVPAGTLGSMCLVGTNWHTWLHMGTEKLQRGACGDGRCEGY